MTDLIERLKSGCGPDPKLDAELNDHLHPIYSCNTPWGSGEPLPCTTSLDACRSSMPAGWTPYMMISPVEGIPATVVLHGPDRLRSVGEGPDIERAWMVAIIGTGGKA